MHSACIVESAGPTGQSGNIQTGIAVANTSSSSASVTFDITDLNGASVGISPFTLTLPGSGQTAKFLSDIFPSLPDPFKGVVRITTTGSGIAVVGLRARYNEQQPTPDFLITTTPPSNEAGAASPLEFVSAPGEWRRLHDAIHFVQRRCGSKLKRESALLEAGWYSVQSDR